MLSEMSIIIFAIWSWLLQEQVKLLLRHLTSNAIEKQTLIVIFCLLLIVRKFCAKQCKHSVLYLKIQISEVYGME